MPSEMSFNLTEPFYIWIGCDPSQRHRQPHGVVPLTLLVSDALPAITRSPLVNLKYGGASSHVQFTNLKAKTQCVPALLVSRNRISTSQSTDELRSIGERYRWLMLRVSAVPATRAPQAAAANGASVMTMTIARAAISSVPSEPSTASGTPSAQPWTPLQRRNVRLTSPPPAMIHHEPKPL
jgi:hypothetical protein